MLDAPTYKRTPMKDMKKFLPLAALIIVFEGISAFIGLRTAPKGDIWYESLVKSDFTPPDWVFGVVWPSLYLLLSIAIWIISSNRSQPGAKTAMLVFGIHMLLNWSWNFMFFELHMIFESFCLLFIILSFAALLMFWFYKISKPAGILLLPYLVWVSFATYLSGYIWIMN